MKEIYWYSPIASQIKCNTDDAALGCPSVVACGGIFSDCSVATLDRFAKYIWESRMHFMLR
jgi:hypothetical protein